jgi:isopenicillin N synthase-like dioxygenase
VIVMVRSDPSDDSPNLPLPVLDLGKSVGSYRRTFLEQLRTAAAGPGFFYLVGHGVPTGLADLVLGAAGEFFASPLEERLRVSNLRSPHFRGYCGVGAERTAGLADQREQLDVGPELPARIVGPDDPPWWRLTGPNLWPPNQPDLRGLLLTWSDLLSDVAGRLLRLLALALELPPDWFGSAIGRDPHTHLKIIRYPGQPVTTPGQAGQGVGMHKDYGLLTLLLQDGTGGLQVLLEDDLSDAAPAAGPAAVSGPEPAGRIVDVPPLGVPGEAFVVNLGEMLEVATTGYLRATSHRVACPPPGAQRLSVPFFFNPHLDAVLTPAPLPPALARRARGITDDPANPLLSGYGANALKGWLRAHPQVAERHHPDLLFAH